MDKKTNQLQKLIFVVLILLVFSILIFNSLSAQIKNPGFEIINDSIPTLPEDWNCIKGDGYTIASDNTIQFTGKRSIRISNSEKQNENAPANVIQYISYKTETTKKLLISAYVKRENLNGTAWLSARLTNPATDNFFNIGRKYVSEGSGNWEKIIFLVITDREVKIRINAGLQGTGTVWFDDITLEDVTGKDTGAVDPDAKELISQFMDTVKTHSLYAYSVNWKKLGMEVAELSRGIKSMEEAHGILHYILSKLVLLGDNHSHLIIDPNRVTVTQAEQVKNLIEIPEGKYIEKNIGYVKIPAFNTNDDTAGRLFAHMVQDVIKNIDQKHKITGWIVDLREDGGGSTPPMVAGLFPLLGFDTLGYFVSPNEVDPWFASREDWNTLYILKNKISRIAVLIGPNTGSSGEATAISFIGKANTKLFGQHSAGLTTANSTFNLRDGSLLALADGVEADRNMKIYYRGIDPDVIVKDNVDKRVDACLETAKNWILGK